MFGWLCGYVIVYGIGIFVCFFVCLNFGRFGSGCIGCWCIGDFCFCWGECIWWNNDIVCFYDSCIVVGSVGSFGCVGGRYGWIYWNGCFCV